MWVGKKKKVTDDSAAAHFVHVANAALLLVVLVQGAVPMELPAHSQTFQEPFLSLTNVNKSSETFIME